MASMRDIKRRRDSIQSTEQITKAMKLVATVKLQKSKAKAENSKPYFNLMYETISSVLMCMLWDARDGMAWQEEDSRSRQIIPRS